VDPGVDQAPGEPLEPGRRGAAVDEHVKPRFAQPVEAGAGDFHRSVQRVAAVAELLHGRAHLGVEQLAELLERAERLLEPGEIGRQHGLGRRATLLARRGQRSAHVGQGVPGGQPVLRRNSGDGSGQVVAHLLAQARQVPVVEHEADIILDDAKPLPGAVGRGIERPKCRRSRLFSL